MTSPFLGVNVQVTQVDTEYNSLTLPKINIGYLSGTVPSGYLSGQLNCTNPSTPTSSQPCDIYQFQNSSGTGGASNGTRVYLNLQQYYLEANGNASFNSAYNYIIDYEFILDDNYRGYVTFNNGNVDKTYYVNGSSFHYSIRQTGLTEITFTITDYSLYRIRDSVMWNFPIESFGAVIYMMTNGFELADFYEYDTYTFPIFKVNQNDVIAKQYINNNQKFIYICMTNNNIYASTLNNYFSVDYGTLQNYKSLGKFIYGQNTAYIFKFEVLNNSGSNRYIDLSYIGANDKVLMPIYYNASTIKFISTDFALRFGLSNDLLDNLDILANGTVSSNQSSNDLENQKGSFDTTSNNLYTSENAFNTDMNNKLQSIDTSFNPSTSFGSKFLSSADWVRTQFNNLTSTSPFGTVLSFSMLLGLSLLIIGKVFK